MTTQEAKLKADIISGILKTIGDIIRGNNGTPSGVLYAALMQYGCSLQQYEEIISALKSVGKVKETNHLLYWID